MNKLYYRVRREFEQEAIYFLVCDTPVNMLVCTVCTMYTYFSLTGMCFLNKTGHNNPKHVKQD